MERKSIVAALLVLCLASLANAQQQKTESNGFQSSIERLSKDAAKIQSFRALHWA
jgi:hypothetical protein